jgi:hypothetical protein
VRHFGTGFALAAMVATVLPPMALAAEDAASVGFVNRLQQMGPAWPFARALAL